MARTENTQVLVVGAGPVGLLAGLSLNQHGLDVQIVDEQWRTAAHSYALALHSDSVRLLDGLGLAEPVVEQGRRLETVAFYDRTERRAELKLSDLSGPYPFLVVMPQAALEGLLERELMQRKLSVSWNHRVAQLDSQEDRAVATIERLGKVSTGYAVATTEWEVERVFDARADFIVGADGHRSVIRRHLDIGYEQLSEPEYFAVFEFDCQGTVPDEVRIVLDETTTNVLWPLPGSQCRWSFQLPADQAKQAGRFKDRVGVQIGRSHFPQLTDEHLHELIRQRAPWFDTGIGNIKWALLIRFERRLADGFGRDRVWLAGDAAHLANPVGMHSMNVGLREAHELAGCAAQILKEGASADVLHRYNTNRQSEWRQLLGLDGQATAAAQADGWVRTHADRILQCIPASGDTLRQLAEQIGLNLPADAPAKP